MVEAVEAEVQVVDVHRGGNGSITVNESRELFVPSTVLNAA